jgi:hypothetical protein
MQVPCTGKCATQYRVLRIQFGSVCEQGDSQLRPQATSGHVGVTNSDETIAVASQHSYPA